MVALKIVSMIAIGLIVSYPFYILKERLNAKIDKSNIQKQIINHHETI